MRWAEVAGRVERWSQVDYGEFDPAEGDRLRMDHLAMPNPYRFVGPVAIVALCTWVAWPTAGHPGLLVWSLTAVAGILWSSTVVVVGHRRLGEREPRAFERRWATATASWTVVTGLWWPLFADPAAPVRLALVVALMLVVVTAACSTLAASPLLSVAYAAPLAVFPLIPLFSFGGDHRITALLAVPLYAGWWGFQIRANRQAIGAIHDRLYFRLLARRQELVFTTMAEALVVTAQGRITEANPLFLTLAGLPFEQVRDRRLAEVLVGRPVGSGGGDGTEVDDFPADGRPVQAMLRRSDGGTVMVEAKGRVLDERGGQQVWICTDVTDRLADAEALQRLADRDDLTGLFNRRAMTTRLEDARLAPESAGILLLDLDGFKEVNDLHGHEAGDRVLAAVVDRLVSVLREDRVIGRMGGDEFLVIAGGLRRDQDLERVAERVCEVVRQPIPVGDLRLQVTASVGLAVLDPSRRLDECLAEADAHMYAAKRSGGNRWVGPEPRVVRSSGSLGYLR